MSVTKTQTVNTVLRIARGEIGVRESNDNSGKRVSQYQAATTLGGSHWPWCVALIAWDFRQTEKELGIEIPWSYSASCDVIWADAKARGLIRATPQAGDVGLVKATKGNGYSTADAIHGFFVGEKLASTVKTIEGNTNADGGREGIGVMSHTRPISNRYVWIRWADALTLASEVAPLPWAIRVANKGVFKNVKATLINGTNYVATGDFAIALSVPFGWDAKESQVTLNGTPISKQAQIIDGRSYFPVRVLAEHMGLSVDSDGKNRVVTIG